MAEDVFEVPVIHWEIPKPKPWDFVALVVVIVGITLGGACLTFSRMTQPGASMSSGLAFGFVLLELAVCCASLLVLGKTAKEGTIHGNLLAVIGMFVGLGGSLLAAALWAIA